MLSNGIRAARYVRKSTDMQRYSIENQGAAIALYAAQRGLTIVRSYEDAGKSGLRLDGCDALKTLIDDVRSGRADFTTILVYDVSRWGRFQDTDDSAHYEFLCRSSGVTVEYCAEQFENDGSLAATLIKNVKRAMAGEYSRELSARVFAGKSKIVANGFCVGSPPGYSLRRFLVDEHGNRKLELADAQRKSIHTDRVILVPGPSHEIATVHHVYDLFVDNGESLNEIARKLNADNVLRIDGRQWTSMTVRALLANEKYIGNCVFNRTSRKLHTKQRRNPPGEWIRAAGAFEPIVSLERFQAAQRQLEANASIYSDAELLNFLTAIWCREGTLNRRVIDASRNAPGATTYRERFGSMCNAFLRVGYARVANRGNNLSFRQTVCKQIAEGIELLGGTVSALQLAFTF